MGLPLENARYQFNLMGFDERVARGELEIVILLMDWPRSDVEELRQTESQIVLYVSRDDGEALAECHRYVFIRGHQRGQLAASARPDPKWLLVENQEWNVSHTHFLAVAGVDPFTMTADNAQLPEDVLEHFFR